MRRGPITILALALLWPAAADARRGPCIPGTKAPLCNVEMGKVTFIDDGDTLDVRLNGSRKLIRVRVTGINAMEQSVYSRDPRKRRGECHALEATARLDRLVKRGKRRVRVTAQRA